MQTKEIQSIPILHQHGGEKTEACRLAKINPEEVVDLSVNISPFGLPQIIQDHWEKLLPTLSPYPSKDGKGISSFYEKKFGWPKEYILPLNGSIEGIYLFSNCLKLKKVLIPTPSFFDYQAAQHSIGVEVLSMDLMQEDAKMHQELEEKLHLVDGVILASPNNPTGKIFPFEKILYFATKFPKVKFLVDLAFWQYTNQKEGGLQYFELPKNLFLLHSLTKFYALAGVRIGALIANPNSLSPFLRVLPPWRINSIAEKLAELLLEASDYEREVKKVLAEEREKIFLSLQSHPKLKLLPSESNFFLSHWGGDLDLFLQESLKAGFFLRDARNFTGLQGDWFRFAIHTPEVNERWINFLLQLH